VTRLHSEKNYKARSKNQRGSTGKRRFKTSGSEWGERGLNKKKSKQVPGKIREGVVKSKEGTAAIVQTAKHNPRGPQVSGAGINARRWSQSPTLIHILCGPRKKRIKDDRISGRHRGRRWHTTNQGQCPLVWKATCQVVGVKLQKRETKERKGFKSVKIGKPSSGKKEY